MHTNLLKGFPLDLSEIKSAVFLHKINNSIKLPVNETAVIGHYCYCKACTGFVVLMVNLGNRNVEPPFQSADDALYDTSLFLQRAYPLHIQLSCHHADSHNFIL